MSQNKKQKSNEPIYTQQVEYVLRDPHIFLSLETQPELVSGQRVYDSLIQEAIVDIIVPAWNPDPSVSLVPSLTPFRSDTLDAAFKKLRSHYQDFQYLVSVDGVNGGHHPLFSHNLLSRSEALDARAFIKVPSIAYLNFDGSRYMLALKSEMERHNNRRLQNFMIFHYDENRKDFRELLAGEEDTTATPRISRERFVKATGLTFHEFICFYVLCSCRRLNIDEDGTAETATSVFSYIHKADVKRIIHHMDAFIVANGIEFHGLLKENQFFELYMKVLYNMMFGPVEVADVDLLHEVLHEEM